MSRPAANAGASNSGPGRTGTSRSVVGEADATAARVELLGDIVALAGPGAGTSGGSGSALPEAVLLRATQTSRSASERLGHGTSHTVIALAGATGSGKSSLFNAIAGSDFAQVGARRPTTSMARAVVFGEGADLLLDWLQIPNRHLVANTADGPSGLEGLVLLDLPDHDSTAEAHRAEVDRLTRVVDVFCWVVDPQKYADAALHEGYIQKFAGHGAVTVVALNQIDRLDAAERRSCIDDLAGILVGDGLVDARVLAVSAATGEGVDSMRREFGARVAQRRAVVARLDADLDWVGDELLAACGDITPGEVDGRVRRQLVAASARVAGVEAAVDAVGGSYRHRASLAVGWPPIRWVRRFRPDPLRRLGLGRERPADESGGPSTVGGSLEVGGSQVTGGRVARRTALSSTPGAMAELRVAGRDLVDGTTTGFPPSWRDTISGVVTPAIDDLSDPLDAAMSNVALPVAPARWWTIAGAMQRLLTLAMVIGMLWLGVLFVLSWFRVPDPPTPKIGAFPLPTLLAIGGALLGLLVATVGRRVASVGARRRQGKARETINNEVGRVVDAAVIGPTNSSLARLRNLSVLVRRFHR